MKDERGKSMTKRKVVTYERVSTEEQLSALENQHRWLDNLLKQHQEDWILVKQYRDEGISGTNTKKRGGFNEMITDLLKKKVDADLVVTREIARFARNTVDSLTYTRKLAENGIEVYFVDQNLYTKDQTGQFLLTIFAANAEEESRRTSIRVRHGQEIARQKGVVFGTNNVLGYDKLPTGEFVINEEQAETVKMIFDMYVNQRMSMKAISFKLEQIGRLTCRGGTIWSQTVVSQIIKNPRYAGYVAYNRSSTKDFLSHERTHNPFEEWIIKKVDTYEPIITKEMWDKAQVIREERHQKYSYMSERPQRGQKQPMHLYSRLLVCGKCGNRFNRRLWSCHGPEKRYGYLCYRQAHYGSVKTRQNKGLPEGKCDAMQITEWKLDLIMREIFVRLEDYNPEEIIKETIDLLQRHLSVNNAKEMEKKRKKIEKQLTQKQSQINKLIDLYTREMITEEHYTNKYEDLLKETTILKKQIEDYNPITADIEAQKRKDRIEHLKEVLKTCTQWDPKSEERVPDHLVETIVREIKVYNDHLEVYLAMEANPVQIAVQGKTKKTFTAEITNKKEIGVLNSATDMVMYEATKIIEFMIDRSNVIYYFKDIIKEPKPGMHLQNFHNIKCAVMG